MWVLTSRKLEEILFPATLESIRRQLEEGSVKVEQPRSQVRSRLNLGTIREGVLPPPGQVHAPEYDRPPDDLVRCENLTEQHHPRGDADEGDQVLVDQNPVSPHPRDPPLPGVKTEGRDQ